MSNLMELVEECTAAADHPIKEEPVNLVLTLANLGLVVAANKVREEYNLKKKLYQIGQEKYVRITPEKIGLFLDRKVAAYNKANNASKKQESIDMATIRREGIARFYRSLNTQSQPISFWAQEYARIAQADPRGPGEIDNSLSISRPTIHRMETTGVGHFVWNETMIENYAGIPPTAVLDKLRETQEKKIFDYFTIATVNEVKDPLLLGRINDHKDRYFLAQWGDDVSLDDVI